MLKLMNSVDFSNKYFRAYMEKNFQKQLNYNVYLYYFQSLLEIIKLLTYTLLKLYSKIKNNV